MDQLGAPPPAVRPDTPPFVPRDWAHAGWHEALFWAALLNLPVGPMLALVGYFDGESLLAVLIGLLGLTPSAVGFVLAFRLAPGESASVRAARTWLWVPGTVEKMEDLQAPADEGTHRSDPDDRKGVVRVTLRYPIPQGEKQGTFLLLPDDPPLALGDSVTVLVDPGDPSSHRVLRQVKGVLFGGALPEA